MKYFLTVWENFYDLKKIQLSRSPIFHVPKGPPGGPLIFKNFDSRGGGGGSDPTLGNSADFFSKTTSLNFETRAIIVMSGCPTQILIS